MYLTLNATLHNKCLNMQLQSVVTVLVFTSLNRELKHAIEMTCFPVRMSNSLEVNVVINYL